MPIALYLISIILLLTPLERNKSSMFMDKNSCVVIKGFFVLLIVLSHILNAFPYSGVMEEALNTFKNSLGQTVVTMFFFISGFGITISTCSNGDIYSKSILTNRFFRIYIYSIVSMIPYVIYVILTNNTFPIYDYFISILGFGRSVIMNWFVKAILFCYLVTGFSYFLKFKKKIISPIIVLLSVIAYIVYFYLTDSGRHWIYDTIITYPVGIFVALYKNKINNLFNKKIICISALIGSIVGYAIVRIVLSTRIGGYINVLVYSTLYNFLCVIFFLSLTRLFLLKNVILYAFGKMSFAIFIMHPFIIQVFIDYAPVKIDWLNYFVLFTMSVLIGIPFYYLYKVIDKYITNPIVKWNRDLVVRHNEVSESQNKE